MSSLFESFLTLVISVFLVVLSGLYLNFKLRVSKYWAKRNVPHVKPVFLLGNMWKGNITENIMELLCKIHLEHKKNKVIGLWAFNKPVLMIMDLNLSKKILISDFNVFRDRGLEVNTELDPLGGHLFLLNGKAWRNLRVKLTPTFTSGKMKLMFPTVTQCAAELEKHITKIAATGHAVEVKDLMARFTTDVIASCAFGLETNSLENPNSEFRNIGKEIFNPSIKQTILNIILFTYPKIAEKLSIRFIPKNISDYFINTVRETVEYREKNDIKRNDFLQLLIQLIRAGKVEDADKKRINAEGLTDDALVQKFSLVEAAAQCFVFLIAGFETSSSALTTALYELAKNPDIQSKLQREIDEKTQNGVSYESTMEMEYLDKVVQETLRKHPPAGNLQRVSNADYPVPELGFTIEKGTPILFSVRGFHYDPDLYPDPERFDPERFSAEEKSQRDNGAFIPFGDGPRSCIGNRFALMQIKVGLIYVLKNYNVEMAETTPKVLKCGARSFSPIPVDGIPLAFRLRL